MPSPNEYLLVPLKVQALVIEKDVIDRATPARNEQTGENNPVAGKWSPRSRNYNRTIHTFAPVVPEPFFDARAAQGARPGKAPVFVQEDAAPADKDRGVYLHWVVPQGLRQSYQAGELHFPALPDQWLVVRWARGKGAENNSLKAVVLDSSVIGGDAQSASLLVPGRTDENAPAIVSRRIGAARALGDYRPEEFRDRERTTITALGNAYTGSQTFTGSIAENRNALSWHDDLNDLRSNGQVPPETTLTYLVLGWYRRPEDEPLRTIPPLLAPPPPFRLDLRFETALTAGDARVLGRQFEKNGVPVSKECLAIQFDAGLSGWWIRDAGEPGRVFFARKTGSAIEVAIHLPAFVLGSIGWSLGTATPPENTLNASCLLHGMVAYINYWNPETYRGPILGYPDAPDAQGGLGRSPLPIKVGLGYAAEDALAALLAEGKDRAGPEAWKALEAVMHRQGDTLMKGWDEPDRELAVHQNWFTAQDAGRTWSIGPLSADDADIDSEDPNSKPKPAPGHLQRLADINREQSTLNHLARQIAALQQDLYARWWKLCQLNRLDAPEAAAVEKQYRALAERLKTLQGRLKTGTGALTTRLNEFRSQLQTAGWQLLDQPAPRFWKPADPVVVVQNAGRLGKHQFDRPLPCRRIDALVTSGEIIKNGQAQPLGAALPPEPLIALIGERLPGQAEVLGALLREAALVERGMLELAETSLPPAGKFSSKETWDAWREQLDTVLNRDENAGAAPGTRLRLKTGASPVSNRHLVDLWGTQPWAPLFIDWEITWEPTTAAGQDFGADWTLENTDYRPQTARPPVGKPERLRGRSLVAPMAGNFFRDALDELRRLIGDLREDVAADPPEPLQRFLSRYGDWGLTLRKLRDSALLGQALSGMQQGFLGRDITLPHVWPNPQAPWNAGVTTENGHDAAAASLLQSPRPGPDQSPLTPGRLSPPRESADPDTLSFGLLRAGSFRISQLWLVDDFGQWADLIYGADASFTSGQALYPRVQWDQQASVVMPPRIQQPTRLNFRFSAAADPNVEGINDPTDQPIAGWVFYHHLDRALVLADPKGRLLGEIALIDDNTANGQIYWESFVTPGAGMEQSLAGFEGGLKDFARGIADPVRLRDLLALTDRVLGNTCPASGEQHVDRLQGRPLALVQASIGLELFGDAWSDPEKETARSGGPTGDPGLDRLKLPVKLGSKNEQDGLIGYFTGGSEGFKHIIPTEWPGLQTELSALKSGYVANPQQQGVRIGFGAPARLTLLMDPYGTVQAAPGIVPVKSIGLPPAYLEETLQRLEQSFRVGPVLIAGGQFNLPVASGQPGKWYFNIPDGQEAPIYPTDPKQFSDQAIVTAFEGRITLRQDD